MAARNVPRFLHSFSKPTATDDVFLRLVEGQGATVVDNRGKRYIDALASLWYCQVGHGRAEIVDAITAQAHRLQAFHTFERFTNDPADRLANELAAIAPMEDARVFLTSGGSEAVDTAIKLARVAHFVAGEPERTLVISRAPSYHGVTFGAVSATGLPLNQLGFGPLVGGVAQVPHDDLDAIDAAVEANGGPGTVAAIIAEPVIGAGGVLPPAPGYLQGLRERADRYGAFLILDEVICGFGRMGAWFAAVRYGVTPDLVTFAKGVTSGYQPVGGVLVGRAVRDRLEADPDFLLRHGTTYSGHPIACAAAVANLRVIRDERLAERADPIGDRLRAGLEKAVDGERVLSVRGEGAMAAARIDPEGPSAIAIRDEMLERGVIARPLGTDVMAFCPPLVISDDQLDEVTGTFADAVLALSR
ncbi:MAG TPA: aminotransferase class III-fold pyridoxal phosphate-dependent enzyme [Acidimicrobiales bacterium]